MPTAAPVLGLRERNRLRRTRRVERAALTLALELGVDNVTVDMICEASDISPRTYFNYFGTKEGALIGPEPSVPDEAFVDEFVQARGPLVEDLMLLIARGFFATEPDRDVFTMRRELYAKEPSLQAVQVARMAGKRQATAELVRRRLASQHPDMPETEARDEAQLVMSVAFGAFPVISRLWIERSGEEAEVETYIHAAIARIRRIVSP
ncbi:TetR/AcrR family transcriptional regulator [Demequina sp. SYSU T00192]|uniref:TetR/AcrR family transcriptional regulator n=1 Tax=Demequina litoralis TaxID=3051660 RepID=A0ABT8G9G7_9MICO|nr:TetR/AcrR family transcriptional regulator [Demequina sp. SYSU T00192]MDN4475707.1 TetR/AcrR family transcriptional regulator [Demequina sp. SYSU T00192]